MGNIPDGFFVNGLLFWGRSFSKDCLLSKGFLIEVPDIRCFSTEQSCEFHEKIRAFLGEFDPDYSLQIQWSVSSDYEEDLLRYEKTAPDSDSQWGCFVRQDRVNYFRAKAFNGDLRKEVLSVFLSHKCSTLPRKGLKKQEEIESFLKSENRAFLEKITRFANIIGAGSLKPMEDPDHHNYFLRFFDPSLGTQFSSNTIDLTESILSNTLYSDGVSTHKDGNVFFKLGDYYHSVFVLRKWPRFVYPGIIIQLIDSLTQDFCITQNIFPLNIEKEIKQEEQAIKHLSGNVQNSGNISLETTIETQTSRKNYVTGNFSFLINFAVFRFISDIFHSALIFTLFIRASFISKS